MHVDDVLALLASGAGVATDGEPVDDLAHALQCATFAVHAAADDELIVAAALHDIGYRPTLRARYADPELPHEEVGARFASGLFGQRVGWLIAQHVPAKRYLVATDSHYAAQLSDASVRSLARQGGAMSSAEIERFEQAPWARDAAQLRRWDDLAKVPNAATLALDELRGPLERVFARHLDETRLSQRTAPWLPPRWVIRTAWVVHRGIYRVSGGRLGLARPKPGKWGMLRLTTVGRRSGNQRSAIIAYFEDGPNLVTLAMNGWGNGEPAWWLNLMAHPDATVELSDGSRQVHAHAASGHERERLWAKWSEFNASPEDLDAYAARRSTTTAVVVLEPRSG